MQNVDVCLLALGEKAIQRHATKLRVHSSRGMLMLLLCVTEGGLLR
jgi:hypothetical protein